MLRDVHAVEHALAPARLPPHRGARLPEFVAGALDADSALNDLTLAVVGVGSVGGNIATHAARLQVGGLLCVDPSSYKDASILTQPILPHDVGRPKASVVGERCKAISPRTRVQVFDGPVQALDLTALADADVVALASDNIACEIAVGARCLALRQPLVIAAVHGESLSAQVRFYGNASSDSPCPACELTQNEWAQVDGETRFSCEGRFDANPVAERLTQPTRSPSFLCSLAADLALQQILRFTLKLGQDVADTMLEFSGYRNATVTSALQARSRCPAEHVTYDQRVPAATRVSRTATWRTFRSPSATSSSRCALFAEGATNARSTGSTANANASRRAASATPRCTRSRSSR
jgi:molybdopterin/thiamine biosynthesis adenylyltransferase